MQKNNNTYGTKAALLGVVFFAVAAIAPLVASAQDAGAYDYVGTSYTDTSAPSFDYVGTSYPSSDTSYVGTSYPSTTDLIGTSYPSFDNVGTSYPSSYAPDYVGTTYPSGSDMVGTSYPSGSNLVGTSYPSGTDYVGTSYATPSTPTYTPSSYTTPSYSTTPLTYSTPSYYSGSSYGGSGGYYGGGYSYSTPSIYSSGSSFRYTPLAASPQLVIPKYCPSGTTGIYPNCVAPAVYNPPAVNNNNNTNTNTNTVTINNPAPAQAQVVYVNQSSYGAPSYYNYNTPTCSISVYPNTISFGQATTLAWSSSYATGGWISYIGTVVLSGSTQVTPSHSMTYTGTFTGQNGQTINCSTVVNVVGSPVTQNTTPYISLSAVPYTGLDLGPFGEVVYWSVLVLLCLGMAYLIVVRRVQNNAFGWTKEFLFGTGEGVGVAQKKLGEQMVWPEARPKVSEGDPRTFAKQVSAERALADTTDAFIFSQIHGKVAQSKPVFTQLSGKTSFN